MRPPGADEDPSGSLPALVLAGSRAEGDALARVEAVRHRALLDVAGVPMLLRVVRTLYASGRAEPVLVSIDDPGAVDGVPELAELAHAGSLRVQRSESSPSRSVLAAFDDLAAKGPLLVTTADHPLLTPEILGSFLDGAEASGADVAIGLVGRETIEARFPGVTRTWLRFRDGDFSGANLFALRTPAARRVVEFWLRAERFRKRPWRLVGAFGPGALLLFLLGRLDLAGALSRVSRATDARVEAVLLPFAEAAVDVDRPSDLELANRVFAERQSSRSPSAEKQPPSAS